MAITRTYLRLVRSPVGLIVTVTLLLTGCSGWRAPPLVDAVRLAWHGFPDVPLSREKIDSLPYASIYAKVGKGPRSLIVLARYDGEDLHWISADHIAIVTRHGRLVKTARFPANLVQTIDVDRDPIADHADQIRTEMTHRRLVDIMPGDHFGVPVTSTYQVAGNESITILERQYDTLVVKEICSAPILDWEFENTFWVDIRTGFIWRSIQHFAPGLPPIDIEVLKPAR